jgi:hypothetical protein
MHRLKIAIIVPLVCVCVTGQRTRRTFYICQRPPRPAFLIAFQPTATVKMSVALPTHVDFKQMRLPKEFQPPDLIPNGLLHLATDRGPKCQPIEGEVDANGSVQFH